MNFFEALFPWSYKGSCITCSIDSNDQIETEGFFIQCVAFLYIFLIQMCYFFKKSLLQVTFEKKSCAKREEKIICRMENSQSLPLNIKWSIPNVAWCSLFTKFDLVSICCFSGLSCCFQLLLKPLLFAHTNQ